MSEETDKNSNGENSSAKKAGGARKKAQRKASAKLKEDAARADDVAANEVRDEERESARTKLMGQLKMFGTIAGLVAKQGVVRSAKMVMPLVRGYVGSDAIKRTDDAGKSTGRISSLTEEETATLMMAGEKLAFESIELASLAYPTGEGIEPYRAVRGKNGRFNAPHLGQLLSLFVVLQRFVGNGRDGNDGSGNGDTNEQEFARIENPVLLTAVTAEDYRYLNMPVLPNIIRRVALNEREMMLSRQASGAQAATMAQTSGAQLTAGRNAMTQNQIMPANRSFAANEYSSIRGNSRFAQANLSAAPATPAATSSCSSCGCSGPAASFSEARYNADGTCMDTMCISCETKWRVRDCVKLAVCEFISCMASEVCADGSFRMPTKIENGVEVEKDIGEVLLDCLGGAMCTTLNCLPEAICGPRVEACCVPPPALECNFAVEEKR